MYHVYAIYNFIRNKIYIGYTDDLDKRLARHNGFLPNKKSSFTSKNGGVWILIYQEETPDRKTAMLREKQLKSCQGRKIIRNIIDNWGVSSVGRPDQLAGF